MGTHMKTTVEIADPLFDAAKKEAERSGCTLRDLIEVGLRNELERRAKETEPFVLRDMSVGGQGYEPGVRGDDPRAMKAYIRLMGQPGYPDTVEGINKMLDDEDEDL
jgi:hypothetical protein